MSDPDDEDDDPTVVIDREPTVTGDGLDKTISLRRRSVGVPSLADDDPVLRLLPAPRGRAVIPAGPHVVEAYPPREILPPPVRASTDAPAAAFARATAAALPSTARLSRRAGVGALVAVGAACVVSLAGIIAIIAWFVG